MACTVAPQENVSVNYYKKGLNFPPDFVEFFRMGTIFRVSLGVFLVDVAIPPGSSGERFFLWTARRSLRMEIYQYFNSSVASAEEPLVILGWSHFSLFGARVVLWQAGYAQKATSSDSEKKIGILWIPGELAE